MWTIAKWLGRAFLSLSVVLMLALGTLSAMAYLAPVRFGAIVSQQLTPLFVEQSTARLWSPR